MKRLVCASLALFLICGISMAAPIKALIVDGQNNHDWKSTTPVLQKILLDTGIFTVDVATSPEAGGDMAAFNPKFSDYGVVILNYNGDQWSKATSDAFVEYVQNGGGVVVVHAADNSFGQWKEYNEIIGFGGWGGRTKESGPYIYWKEGQIVYDSQSDGPSGSHEHYGEFVVTNRAKDHPILKGMPDQWYQTDELYNCMRGPGKNMTILATAFSGLPKEHGGTGRDEPMLFTIDYGKGRVFHTTLGHDAPSMQCKGFALTFARGAEWAATGQVTIPVPKDIPAVLKAHEALGALNEKSPADPLLGVLSEIGEASNDAAQLAEIENALIGYLKNPDVNFLAVQAACNALGVMGTARCVPALVELLAKDPKSSDAARLALERMKAPEAGPALVAALQKETTANKIGIVNSLGARREAAAVPVLATLGTAVDADLANAAMAALGKIGTKDALAALKAFPATPRETDALIECAHALARSENKADATPVFEMLLTRQNLAAPQRYAALQGILSTAPDKGMAEVWKMLEQPDTLKMALSVLGSMPGDQRIVEAITQRFDALPVSTRAALLPVLGAMGNAMAAPKILELVQTMPDGDIRTAALDALGQVPGNEASIKILCGMAINANNTYADKAHTALVRTPGTLAEDAIIAGITGQDEPTRMELIKVAAERHLAKACEPLFHIAAGAESPAQIEAFNALRAIAGAREYETLIALAVAAPESASEAAIRAAKAAGRKIENPAERATPYIGVMEAGNDRIKCLFLPGLADIGGPDALRTAEKYARNDNEALRAAAIEALAHWKDPEAIDTVLGLAAAADAGAAGAEQRVALMKALAGLMAKPSEQPPDAKLAQCRKALDLGLDTEGKRALIAAVGQVMDERALELLEQIGEDPAVADDVKKMTPAIKQKLLAAPLLSASHGNPLAGNAMDGNPSSRWTTNADQVPGMWFMIDLRMRSDISSIELDTTASPDDYPRGYEVYIANKKEDMGGAVASGKGDGPITKIAFDKPINGRFIKIVQTGEVKGLWWSIHEIHVAHNPGFPEVPPPATKLADLDKTGGYVTAWNVAGPYMQGARKGEQLLNDVLGPEMDAKLAMWAPLPADAVKDGVVDFDGLFAGDNRVAYLVCDLVAENASDAELRIGSDDGVKVWLNRELVHSNGAARPVKKDEDKVTVHLKPGDNTLLVKVANYAANWGACVHVVPK